MNLVEKLSKEELKMFDNYRRDYAIYDSCGAPIPVEDLLQEWSNAKQTQLYKILGEEIVISKEIKYTKSDEELSEKISDLLYGGIKEARTFVEAWKDFVYEKFSELKLDRENPEFCMYYNMDRLMLEDALISNSYNGETFYVNFPNGDKYKVQKGCKVSKALGKIANAFNVAGYEEFRIAHSQILNEKTLKGRLYLSIHPLDYATMSDNRYDWTSCMSWEDNGEYRRGTVEMMNSEYVVVAYLDGSTPMPLRGGEWNNKKWRELFIVSKDCISGIKGYPYWNRDLEKITLAWLKELVEKNTKFRYTEDVYAVYNPGGHATIKIKEFDNREFGFYFHTFSMYNDCYDYCNLYVGVGAREEIDICYSGKGQCLCCGRLDGYFSDEGMLYCEDCDDAQICSHCGCRIEEGDEYYLNDEVYCRYCYDDLPYCDSCKDVHNSESHKVYLEKDGFIQKWCFANLCEDCYNYNSHFSASDIKTYETAFFYVHYLPCSALDLDDEETRNYIEATFNIDFDTDFDNVSNSWQIYEK